MIILLYEKLPNFLAAKMTTCQNDSFWFVWLSKWPYFQMTRVQNDSFMKCPVDKNDTNKI